MSAHRVIAVTVPFRNRLPLLKRTVPRMLSPELGGLDAYWIFVDDDSDSDATQFVLEQCAAARRYGVDAMLMCKGEGHLGVSRAVADGWRYSDQELGAEYLIKLDSDVVVQRADWLLQLWLAYQNARHTQHGSGRHIGILGLPLVPLWDDSPLVTIYGNEGDVYRIQEVQTKNVNGGCMMIDRQVLRTIGYPWVPPHPYGGFDAEYSVRAWSAAYWTGYLMLDRAAMEHHEDTDMDYSRWKQRSLEQNLPHLESRRRQIAQGEIYVPYWRDAEA